MWLNKLLNMPKKKIAVILPGALLIEYLLAWQGFVYVPILGAVMVVMGWVTLIYGAYLLLRTPRMSSKK